MTRGRAPRQPLTATMGLGAIVAALAAVLLAIMSTSASALPGPLRVPVPADSTSAPDSTTGAPTSSTPVGPIGRVPCLVSDQNPHQRTTDTAVCRDFAPGADGSVRIRQWQREFPHRRPGHQGPYVFRFFHVGSFHTGPHGNALHIRFRIFPVIRPGLHQVTFKSKPERWVMFLNVKPAAAA